MGTIGGLPPITDRLLSVIAALQRLPVPTRTQGVASTAHAPVSTTRAILVQLEDGGWVERTRLFHLARRGQAPDGWQLTTAGRVQAGARFDLPAPTGSSGQPGDDTGSCVDEQTPRGG